jgi:hypothetical protein
MSLAPVRAKKKEAEQAIAQILLEFSREAQPSNISMVVDVSRLMNWGEDIPADFMFSVNITCEV